MIKGIFNQIRLPEHRCDLFPLHSLYILARPLLISAEWKGTWTSTNNPVMEFSFPVVVPPSTALKFLFEFSMVLGPAVKRVLLQFSLLEYLRVVFLPSLLTKPAETWFSLVWLWQWNEMPDVRCSFLKAYQTALCLASLRTDNLSFTAWLSFRGCPYSEYFLLHLSEIVYMQ